MKLFNIQGGAEIEPGDNKSSNNSAQRCFKNKDIDADVIFSEYQFPLLEESSPQILNQNKLMTFRSLTSGRNLDVYDVPFTSCKHKTRSFIDVNENSNFSVIQSLSGKSKLENNLDSSGYSSAHSSGDNSKNSSPVSSPYSSPHCIKTLPLDSGMEDSYLRLSASINNIHYLQKECSIEPPVHAPVKACIPLGSFSHFPSQSSCVPPLTAFYLDQSCGSVCKLVSGSRLNTKKNFNSSDLCLKSDFEIVACHMCDGQVFVKFCRCESQMCEGFVGLETRNDKIIYMRCINDRDNNIHYGEENVRTNSLVKHTLNYLYISHLVENNVCEVFNCEKYNKVICEACAEQKFKTDGSFNNHRNYSDPRNTHIVKSIRQVNFLCSDLFEKLFSSCIFKSKSRSEARMKFSMKSNTLGNYIKKTFLTTRNSIFLLLECLLLLLFTAFIAKTLSRNTDWSSRATLWR